MAPSVSALNTPSSEPTSIGRFQVEGCLGKGAQGVVYLASDPAVGRQVAIKTLVRHRRDQGRLLEEARNVGRLQHAHIVPLYEVGMHEGSPYLVYQFVKGTPLRKMLDDGQAVPQSRAIPLVCQLLEAIGYAHEMGIVHRDLSPANILIGADGAPRILDFGVSSLLDDTRSKAEVIGTANYMAPEYLSGGEVAPAADVFSISVLLHELLTGRRLFFADSQMAVMYKILNEKILPPSTSNGDIDQQLDAIVMQGLEKEPAKRFRQAGQMCEALRQHQVPADTAGTDDASGAVEFLLRRMKRNPDFPAVSECISEISQKSTASSRSDANELANVILKDFALTTKLLRLVNSALYTQYGGDISTVSRAAVILGFEQVRAVALSIALFEHMNNGDQAGALKDAACGCFLSAVMARNISADHTRVKIDPEEAFVAAMFHQLGRSVTIYYFPEEFREIEKLIANKGMEEVAAARAVIGASFTELGIATGKEWKLPENIINSMRKPLPGEVKPTPTIDGTVAQIASMANEITTLVGANEQENIDRKLEAIVDRYGKCFKVSTKKITSLVEKSTVEASEFASTINIDVRSSGFYKNVAKRYLDEPIEVKSRDTANAPAATKSAQTDKTNSVPATVGEDLHTQSATATAQNSQHSVATANDATTATATATNVNSDRKTLLVNSITEITSVLLGAYEINDVFMMILEAFYRGMGFSRVLLCVRDAKSNSVHARFGFGPEVDELLKKFSFKTGAGNDIFQKSVTEGREFIVLNATRTDDEHVVPEWCRTLTNPTSVVVFPIMANKRCIALIYADTMDHPASIAVDELRLLKALVNQASLAIQQRKRPR